MKTSKILELTVAEFENLLKEEQFDKIVKYFRTTNNMLEMYQDGARESKEDEYLEASEYVDLMLEQHEEYLEEMQRREEYLEEKQAEQHEDYLAKYFSDIANYTQQEQKALIKLCKYVGFDYDKTEKEFIEEINNSLTYDAITLNKARDDKYYFWYDNGENQDIIIRVEDLEIIDEEEIIEELFC